MYIYISPLHKFRECRILSLFRHSLLHGHKTSVDQGISLQQVVGYSCKKTVVCCVRLGGHFIVAQLNAHRVWVEGSMGFWSENEDVLGREGGAQRQQKMVIELLSRTS